MIELIFLNFLFHSIVARHGFWSGMQFFKSDPFIWCMNTNQAFYSQTSWGRLEMKPHEPKKKNKTRAKKKGENKGRELFHSEEETNFDHFDVEGDSKKGVKRVIKKLNRTFNS
jgi:hypothetical protein